MRQFALECEMDYSQLSKIERGTINTTVSTAYVIANALNVPVKELFDFTIKNAKDK